MKNINVLLASVLLAGSVSLHAQIDTLGSKSLQLKGKVKKVEDYSFLLEAESERY